MKALKNILLFVVCLSIASCGVNDLDAYKDQVLEYGAKKFGTTKELFIKDFDVVVDSMSLFPITVQDSINLINNLDVYKESLQAEFEEYEILKNKRFYRWKMRDTERVQEIEEELVLIDKAKAKLPEYESMDKSKTLMKVFRCWIAIKLPLIGRQTGIDYYLFSTDGDLIKSADSRMVKYIKEEKL